MSYRIEIELDDQGRLVFPLRFANQLGLAQGSTLVVEQETADATYLRVQTTIPTYIEKGGIFVIPADSAQIVHDPLYETRSRRLDDIWDSEHAHPL